MTDIKLRSPEEERAFAEFFRANDSLSPCEMNRQALREALASQILVTNVANLTRVAANIPLIPKTWQAESENDKCFLLFFQKNPSLKNTANRQMIEEILAKHDLPFTLTNISSVASELGNRLGVNSSDDEPSTKGQLEEEALPAWGFVLDLRAIRDLPKGELARHMRHPVYGHEFKQALNALQLPR